MRFSKLEIPAFGPFTEFQLDFPNKGGDFHLIYGANEAGKSSLLRAMRAMLFGIATRSSDNFIHDFKSFRIVAELQKNDGTAQTFQRRKGRKDTLLDETGKAVSEEQLLAFLGVVDESYFDSMFGLGGNELRQGADELLRGEGKLGEALFSASLGGTPVERVIDSLKLEADRYFAGRAAKSIRQASTQLKEQLKQSKASWVKASDWELLQDEIKNLELQRERLLNQRKDEHKQIAWLERCRDALPSIGQIKEVQHTLQGLVKFPPLSQDFPEDIRRARTASQQHRNEQGRLTRSIAQLKSQAAKCPLAPKILSEENTIDQLHTELGSYRNRCKQLVAGTSDIKQLQSELTKRCRDLELDQALDQLDECRISEPAFQELQQMAGELELAETKKNDQQSTQQRLAREIAGLEKKQAVDIDPSHTESLESAIVQAGLLEAMVSKLSHRRSDQQAARQALQRAHSQLAGAPEQTVDTRNLTPPTKLSIECFRERFDQLKQESSQLDQESNNNNQSITELESEIKRLSRQRQLPSLDDLVRTRQQRDLGWSLVLEDWKGSGASRALLKGKALEDAYPETVAAADNIADRLCEEAEAVAQIEEKRSLLESATRIRKQLERQQQAKSQQQQQLHAEWNEAWSKCDITPRSPREMSQWHDSWTEFCQTWEQAERDRSQLNIDEQAEQQACIELATVIKKKELKSFPQLLALARTQLNHLKTAAGAASAIAEQIQERNDDLAKIEADLPALIASHQQQLEAWNRRRESHSLPNQLSPKNVIALLQSRRDMFRQYDQWQSQSREQKVLQQQVDHYQQRVHTLCTKLLGSSNNPHADEASLSKALQAARMAAGDHQHLNSQIDSQQGELIDAEAEGKLSEARLLQLLTQAQLENEAQLDAFLPQLEIDISNRSQMASLRKTLAGLARTQEIDDFIQRVEQEDSENIDDRLIRHQQQITALEQELSGVDSNRHELQRQHDVMSKADDQAARHQQLAESSIAEIHHDADRFVRLRLAISLLESQIERFREENQGPFMEKASAWFSEITGGAFSGITTHYNERDQALIAGLRAGSASHDSLPIEAMSEGTRDQLYLALRFAGLEMHLHEHEPMPMILDDLLVHFDDQRSSHALAALGKLGQKSQVLLFTHHPHLIELARRELGSKRLHLHRL